MTFTAHHLSKKVASGLFAIAFIGLQAPLALFASPLAAADTFDSNVIICSAAGNEEPTTYKQITVSAEEILSGDYGDQGLQTEADIIPVFSYDGDEYESFNFDTAHQAIYNNSCVMPTAVITDEEDTPPTDGECVDGHTQQNLNVVFVTPNRVTITAADNAQLCEDQTVFFSAYIMSRAYDGRGFFPGTTTANPTAYPQTLFDSASVTLPAHTSINKTLTIGLPATCENTQVDVYYAPEITAVGPEGHGTENIVSDIYLSTGACNVVTTPEVTVPVPPTIINNNVGRGGGEAAAPATTALALLSPAAVAKPATASTGGQQLINTGSNLLLNFAVGLTLMGVATTLAATGRRQKA